MFSHQEQEQLVLVGQFARCPICGAKASNECVPQCTWSNCPYRRLHEISKRIVARPTLSCPKCKRAGSVGLNAEDLFECHDCHAQFTTGLGCPEWEETVLVDLFAEDQAAAAKVVKVHPEHGKGNFPTDEALLRMKEHQRRRFNRWTKMIGSLRRHAGCDVTFDGHGLSVDVVALMLARIERLEAKDRALSEKKK